MAEIERVDTAMHRNAHVELCGLASLIGEAGALGTCDQRDLVGHAHVEEAVGLGGGRERPGLEASVVEILDRVRPSLAAHDCEMQHLAHRDAHCATRIGVGARGVEQHCVEAQSAR